MAVYAGPEIFTNGLVLALDAGNTQSYPGSGTTWDDLISAGQRATFQDSSNSTFEWTLRTTGFGSINIGDLVFANSIYVASSNQSGGRLITSTDAITWTSRTSGFGISVIRGLTFGNNTYVAGGDSAILNTSTDAITWTLRTINFGSTNNIVISINYVNGIYIAGGQTAKLSISTDAITWTLRTINASNSLNTVIFGGTNYVLGSQVGAIFTSTDSIIWTERTSGLTSSVGSAINSLAFNSSSNTYVATSLGNVNPPGAILTSTNAIEWTLRTSGATGSLYDILYVNNTYIINGNTGFIAVSTDAITWTARTSNTTSQLNALTLGNNTYVTGGNSGTIATSSLYSASSPTYSTTNLGYFSFNGVDQYATYSATPLNVNSYTKSVWFRLSNLSTNNNLISASPGHFMYFAGTNKLYCGHSDWGDYAAYPSITTFSTGVWYNACLTFNTTDGMVLYVNGVQDSTYTAVKTPAAGSGIEIASFGTGNFLTGDVSQVFVYNKSLTASEVSQNFNALRGRFGI